jgi:hypothetical protein
MNMHNLEIADLAPAAFSVVLCIILIGWRRTP